MEEKINYFLALEKMPGNYMIIDINRLDICQIPVNYDISQIDAFTKNFTEEEIKESVERSNMMVSPDYLSGTLKIVSNKKHNLEVFTKDKAQSIVEMQLLNDLEHDLKHKLYDAYKNVVDKLFKSSDFSKILLEELKKALDENNKAKIFKIIEELPYDKARTIYLKISKEYKNQKYILRNLTKGNEL